MILQWLRHTYKWLFSFIIVVKVPLVVTKGVIFIFIFLFFLFFFLKKILRYQKRENLLDFSFPWFDILICD